MERLLKATLPTGKFTDVPETRSRIMAAIRGKHNVSTDRQFRMALVRAGIQGWRMHTNLPGKPDFYFPKIKLAVFLDGCFWHGCKRCGHIPKTNSIFWATKIGRTKSRDRKTTRLIRQQGVVVLRVWEHSLKNKRSMIKILHTISRYNSNDWNRTLVNNADATTQKGQYQREARSTQDKTRPDSSKLLHRSNGTRSRARKSRHQDYSSVRD